MSMCLSTVLKRKLRLAVEVDELIQNIDTKSVSVKVESSSLPQTELCMCVVWNVLQGGRGSHQQGQKVKSGASDPY